MLFIREKEILMDLLSQILAEKLPVSVGNKTI